MHVALSLLTCHGNLRKQNPKRHHRGLADECVGVAVPRALLPNPLNNVVNPDTS